MLKLSALEFFIRVIPESFLVVFSVYTFSKTAIEVKRCSLSSMIFAIMTFIIRLLPIQYGVHTILSIIALIVLIVNINKIDIIKSIQSVIITIIFQFICEGINVLLIQNVFDADINYVFSHPMLKILYGIPSIVILACIVTLYYARLLKKKELKYV